MKKIFSLVALVGIFALMSFSLNLTNSNKAEGGGGWDYCNEYATEYAQQYDWDSAYQRSWYKKCVSMQQQ